MENLEATILAGPPRAMFPDDIDPDEFDRIVKNQVWLYLAKLAHDQEMLSPTALSCLLDVPPGWSDWRSERNEERNEFSFWLSGTGAPDYEESRDIEIAPRKRWELAKWLKQPPPTGRPFYEDTWRETCRTRFFHSHICLVRLESRKTMADHSAGAKPYRFGARKAMRFGHGALPGRSFNPCLMTLCKSLDMESLGG